MLLERNCQNGLVLFIWTSKTQVMAKRKAGSQIGTGVKLAVWLLTKKVKNRPDLLGCRGRATYRWKALNKTYNFALNYISIQGLLTKLWGSKVARVPIGAISGLSLRSPEREKPFGCGLRDQPQSIL
jgi:hypothetical protein